MSGSGFLSAKEAAAELNVSLATLYAYVSRGMIRSEPARDSRRRLYSADDVRALVRRKQPGEPAARPPLDSGEPVLESAITLIRNGAIFYRGQPLQRVMAESSLETVAGLIWAAGTDPFAAPPRVAGEDPGRWTRLAAGLPPLERCQALLPVAFKDDPTIYNLSPAGVAMTGARIIRRMLAIVTGQPTDGRPAHEHLARNWHAQSRQAVVLRAALVAAADHELNASAFTVRCVASTRASPVAAVVAGLAALTGPRHGGVTERVAAALPDLLATDDPHAAVARRLRRGDDLPGFGHPLYPDGDPRYGLLVAALERAGAPYDLLDRAARLAAAARDLAGRPPTLDVGLALIGLALDLPEEAPLTLFALGRSVGWIGHAIEQYADPKLIRPRARYVGPLPE